MYLSPEVRERPGESGSGCLPTRPRQVDDDVARAEEHEKLLTYIPPASVGRAGCDDGACATA